VTARHRRQLDKAKARRQRGQAGHRWLPDTRSLRAKWSRDGRREFRPADVELVLSTDAELLHARALRLAAPHIETLCADYRLEPQTVLSLFGPELHAAALITAFFGTDVLPRQLRSIRRFLNRPAVQTQLAAWHEIRRAS
jgi:hypothetical protein